MEYIEREKAIDEIDKWLDSVGYVTVGKGLTSYGELIGCLEDTPAADVVEVRHSYWQCSNVRMSSRDITCRYCHRTETISNGNEDFEYCPHCGAKMEERTGNND